MKAIHALAAFWSLLLFVGSARAFHSGADYAKTVFEGGSGGIYYLGTRKERGWTCTMCHVEAPGRLKLRIVSEPPELALEQRYVPGQRYEVTIDLIVEGAELGAENPQSNYNALALAFQNEEGAPHGTVNGKADRFVTVNFSTLLVTGNNPRETSWTFAWTPRAEGGLGPAHLHVGAVDGNGGGKIGETFTDPFGDDVVMAHFVLKESGTQAAATEPSRSSSGGQRERTVDWAVSSASLALLLLGLLAGVRLRVSSIGGPMRMSLLFTITIVATAIGAACGDDAQNGTSTGSGCPPGVICGEGGAGANNPSSGPGQGPGQGGSGQGGGCQEAWLCTPWESSPPGSDSGVRTCTDLANCGTTDQKPVETAQLPALDLDYYKCEIEPILDGSCSMLGCHGTDERPLRTYSRGRFRNVEESVPNTACPSGGMTSLANCVGSIECACWQHPHTATEWQRNFDAARGFGLDAQGNPLADNETSELIQQPMDGGGKAHAGFKLFGSADAEHTKIKAWLDGTTFGQACQTNN